MKKKLTAILVTLTMILSCLVPAYAADYDVPRADIAAADTWTEQTGASDMDELPADIAENIGEYYEEEAPETEAANPEEANAPETESDIENAPDDELMTDPFYDEMTESAAELPSDESGPSLDESGLALDEAALPSDESGLAAADITDDELVGAGSLLADGKTVYIRSAANSGYVVCIAGASTVNHANVEVRKNTACANQKFMVRKLDNGNFVFYNFKSSKVIGAASHTPISGHNVHQYEYVAATNQQWVAVANADGTYSFLNAANKKLALALSSATPREKVNIQVTTRSTSKAQRFTLAEAPFGQFSGSFSLRPAAKTSMAETVASSSKASGAKLQLGSATGSAAQVFTFRRVWGGYYLLINKNSGMVLGTAGQARTAGTYVNQYEKKGWKYQLWKPLKNSDGTVTFYSRLNSDMVLDTGGTGSGTRLRITKYKGAATQKFQIKVPVQEQQATAFTCRIRSAYNTDRTVHLLDNNTANNTNIQLYDYTGHIASSFKFVPVTYKDKSNYYYRIETNNGKVLDVSGGKAASGANIRQMTWTGAAGQIWFLTWNSDGTTTIGSALGTGYCLAVSSATDKNKANIVLAANKGQSHQKWYLAGQMIKACSISSADNNTVTVTSSGIKPASDDGKAYLFAVAPYQDTLGGASPLTSASLQTSMTFRTSLNKNSTSSLLQKKFYVAVKYKGVYRIASNGYYITNPQMASTRLTAFPSPARKTKKGLKTTLRTVDINQAKALNCSHVVIDFPLEVFLNGSSYSYKYEGKTYNFSTSVTGYKNLIKNYNSAGIVVTGIFYLSNRSLTDYILPSAVSGARAGKGVIFALNTENGNRKRLEALFACLADEWTKDGCMVANWVFGNETDQYITYNYSGNLTYDQYHEAFADAFRMFNASVKSRWRNARTYISLDHNWGFPNTTKWTTNYKTYPGLYLTKDFDKDLKNQGGIHWDMAMHPYPSPEQDCKVWIRSSAVTNSGTSKQITPLNMSYFASYLKKTYGSGIHIILPESGLSSKYGSVNQEDQQACAVAYSYYLAEFNSNIDMYGYHREMDKSGETAGGWYMGLYHADGRDTYGKPKKSADVFKYMDTKSYSSHVSSYMKKYLGTSWTSKIPNWNPSKFK
ncbi:MAG: RICIN domain-containing protein [Lachnospiraceae bacterium]|nr:RICIN domain-containing protein [Lachnospiraceae bacterium]